MTIRRQLDELAARIARAQQELEIARDQVAFQTGVTDDAQIRMVVSGTPLADREYREARDDLERLRRHEERVRAWVVELAEERDALLERLLESMDPPSSRAYPDEERSPGHRSRRS
jgi:DNA repair exonuclease SbcCD ATPase subunit